ncbi:helix-turn-helix transcriptional regulator [Croceitalea sp. P059]|uniref:helix-turn-helix domain-containing protein n=1 Tax=Croceitalea sp. P059 TaxID=3075601 RepID=UPI0028867502|nr:helix-turn-helix transcriptional regulator [Croceitalea sp. P059]MDT0538431.1 helix-turn-helix transcriptional regulator [Croceitalea sp. P059]
MSFFGKNIKKIRSVQNLSQQDFSKIFDLKRATLGAYEEQRSEPKIETIIKIANYFSISIDDLLTNELTVNELLKFKADFTTNTAKVPKNVFPIISCVTAALVPEYPSSFQDDGFMKSLPKLQLPVSHPEVSLAFEVQNLEMTHLDRGFYPKDVIIGCKVAQKDFKNLDKGSYCVLVTDENLIFRRSFFSSHQVTLKTEHKNIEDITMPISSIKQLWHIRHVFCNQIPDFTDMIEGRLTLMHQDIQKLHEIMR